MTAYRGDDLGPSAADRATEDAEVDAIKAGGRAAVANIRMEQRNQEEVHRAEQGGRAAVISAHQRGKAKVIEGFFDGLGPGTKGMLKGCLAMATLCMFLVTSKYVLQAYNALFSSGEAPQAVTNTRNLVNRATDGNDTEVALRARLMTSETERNRLQAIVNARVATCEQVEQREAQTGGQGVAATREALAACQIQLRTLTDTRLTREDCQQQAQDACNAAIASTCPQAGQNVRIRQQAQ